MSLKSNLNNQSNSKKSQALSLFFAGILPLIAFTVIEEYYGVVAGLVTAMIFGIGEVIYEWVKFKSVSAITCIGNLLILLLGGISLFSQDGIWFKLQPALLEFGFFIFLFASWIIKKPFLTLLIEKQNPNAPEFLKSRLSGMTLRLSFFMLIHSLLATWAAFYWSSEAWALLKGLGVTLSMILFMLIEVLWARRQILNNKNQSNIIK